MGFYFEDQLFYSKSKGLFFLYFWKQGFSLSLVQGFHQISTSQHSCILAGAPFSHRLWVNSAFPKHSMNYREINCFIIVLTTACRRISAPRFRAPLPSPPSFLPTFVAPCCSPHGSSHFFCSDLGEDWCP